MNRGDVYLVRKPGSSDPRKRRAFVVVSRQALLDSGFSSVICVPVYRSRSGLSTQVDIGVESGLKRESAILCDALVSLERGRLTDFVGTVPVSRMPALDRALAIALGLT